MSKQKIYRDKQGTEILPGATIYMQGGEYIVHEDQYGHLYLKPSPLNGSGMRWDMDKVLPHWLSLYKPEPEDFEDDN